MGSVVVEPATAEFAGAATRVVGDVGIAVKLSGCVNAAVVPSMLGGCGSSEDVVLVLVVIVVVVGVKVAVELVAVGRVGPIDGAELGETIDELMVGETLGPSVGSTAGCSAGTVG